MYLPKTDDPAFEDLIEDYLDEAVPDQMALRIEVRLREDRAAREVLLHCLTARSLLGLALGEPDASRPPGPACAEFRALRSRYARGALDPKQQARLCAHLEDCPSCESHYAQPEETPGVSWRRFATIGVAIGALALISSIGWGGLREGGGAGPAPSTATADAGLAIIPGLDDFWEDLSPLLRTRPRGEGFPGIQEVCDVLESRGILDAVVTHPEVESRLDGLVDPDADPWAREQIAVMVAVLLDQQVPQTDRKLAVAAVRRLAGRRGLPFLWYLASVAESDDFHGRVMGEVLKLGRRGVHREGLARECRRALAAGWLDSALTCLRFLEGLDTPLVATVCRGLLVAPPPRATPEIMRTAAEALLRALGPTPRISDLDESIAAVVNPLGQAAMAAVLYESDPQPCWHARVAAQVSDPDPRVRRVVVYHLIEREDAADRALCEILCQDPEEWIREVARSLLSRLDARSSRPEERKQPPRAR